MEEKKYYEKVKDWDFSKFDIRTESLTNFDIYELLKSIATKESKVLDLGTGGGEKVLEKFPKCGEILATDFAEAMIETANKNLIESKRENITFRLMDNLKMDVPDNYFDVVIARNTVTDPKQIYKCLKKGGYLLIQGVDKYDCHSLKLLFRRGQAFNDKIPISIIDYEHVLNSGFKEVELVPIHKREFFKNKELFVDFLKKVPIIDDCSDNIYETLIDKYIEENTFNGEIRLIRRYYGIIAKK